MSDASDAVERAELEALHRAAPADVVGRLGIRSFYVGSAFVSMAAGLPASAIVVNRTIGLGLDSLASKDDVDRIVASYRDAGISRYFVHVHPNAKPTGLGAWLRAAGLEKARGWQKFVRGAAPPPEVRTDLAIRRSDQSMARTLHALSAMHSTLGHRPSPGSPRSQDKTTSTCS